ncbi:hypothetical protein CC80DRAFT_309446 [Byssothecium circinans]|uniref:Uncharacterized protein n=1 Tax=Byssothecium circinans TaxID=147558 RepID=A0A6A5U4E3_9PLEO|nr:hypothetical protein CC80DRAFT_309446 [Byssothecium circinans]
MPRLEYIDHPDFPASALIDHPHILKDNDRPSEVDDIKNLRLCDAIATLLHHLEAKQPGILRSFFSPNLKYFKFTRFSERGNMRNFFLCRKGEYVTTGRFEYNPGEGNRIEWTFLSNSTIEENGSWRPVYGCWKACSQPPVDSFLDEWITHIGGRPFMPEEVSDEKMVPKAAFALGKIICERKLWEEHDQPTFTFETKMEYTSEAPLGPELMDHDHISEPGIALRLASAK